LVKFILLLIVFACYAAFSARPGDVSTIKLPAIYSDGAIFQRDCPNTIKGTATPYAPVIIRIAGKSASTNASSSGAWQVTLPDIPAGGPYTMSIDACSHKEIRDIRFGDVWLCCGQSNMGLPLSECNHNQSDLDACHCSEVRFFQIADTRNSSDSREASGSSSRWLSCSPPTVLHVSGCAFFFAKSLQADRKIPVGVIVCAANGSGIRSWLSDNRSMITNSAERGGWVVHQMLSTAIGLSVKGMIWYQGEADIFNVPFYVREFPHLLSHIRQLWNQPKMPCIIVQLPNYAERDESPRESLLAEFREAQRKLADSNDNTYMIDTYDTALNEHVGLHPRDKSVIGKRLALMAEAIDTGSVSSFRSPPFVSMSVEGDRSVLYFDCRENNLASVHSVSGFAIAGADEHFYWARALVSHDGCSVRVWSPQVDNPCAVRYAWSDNPDANLYSSSRMPVEPFRTDNFEVGGKKFKWYRRYDFINDIPDCGPRKAKAELIRQGLR
jgi:sialate O-acetylesterase